jgi:hypothetical protein
MGLASSVKKPKRKRSAKGSFQDILQIIHWLNTGSIPEKAIEPILTRLHERLGKRSRCALLEGDDLKLRFWAGEHSCPIGGVAIDKDSIVWDAVRKGTALNLTKPRQTEGYKHSLAQPVKIKSVIPLNYIDPVTQQTRKLGALIVDSGQDGSPVSDEDFEYLQVIGELIGAIVGRAELIQQLTMSCRRQEEILMQTAHNFRNSIAVIGGYSRRISQMAANSDLASRAGHLYEEVKTLEGHLAEFEKYMNL